MKKLALLVAIIIGIVACKKDKNGPDTEPTPETPQNYSLSATKSTYYPYEVMAINSGSVSLSDSVYVATINSSTYTARRGDKSLYLMLPQLSAGDQSLSLKINNTTYTVGFKIIDQPVIANTGQYFNTHLQQASTNITLLQNYLTSVSTVYTSTALTADINLMNTKLVEVQNQFNSLSPAEQKQVCEVLQANQHWLDSLNYAIDNLNIQKQDYMRGAASPLDIEIEFNVKTSAFLHAVGKAVVSAGLVYMTIKASVLFSPIIAGVMLSGSIYAFITSLQRLIAMEGILLNFAYNPEFLSDLLRNSSSAAAPVFLNNTVKTMTATSQYRTFYANDAFSSNSTVSGFYNACKQFYSTFNTVAGYLSFVLNAKPVNVDQLTNYKTYSLVTHSKYLSINNISTPNVLLNSFTKNNGLIQLSFKRNTQDTVTDINFSFNLHYESPYSSHDKTINAVLKGSAGAPLDFTFGTSPDTLSTPNLDGAISIFATGGIAPYQYDRGTGFQSSNLFQNVQAGTYSVTVKDAANQTKSKVVTVNGI